MFSIINYHYVIHYTKHKKIKNFMIKYTIISKNIKIRRIFIFCVELVIRDMKKIRRRISIWGMPE
jgi:hypothetical protein